MRKGQRKLRPGEVRCGECRQPLLEAAAVIMRGQPLHPIGCFEPALRKWIATLDALVAKGAGAVDWSISMGSVSPKIAYHLGQLTIDVLQAARARRAAR